MNKKGFTLIELLAVIVILAIIALIATPTILGVIEKAKKGAAESSALGYIDAIEKQVMINEMDNTATKITDKTYSVSDLKTLGVTVKGDEPSEGSVTIEKGNVTDYNLKFKDYTVTKTNGKVTVKKNESTKTEEVKAYENGTAIYYNPTTGEKCTESEAVSLTGTKSGCMKWYTFNDEEGNSSVNMILDHNTTAKVAWNSSGNNSEMKEVARELENDTKAWKNAARLITANEVAKISRNTNFDASKTGQDWFYLGSNNQSDKSKRSNYGWLYDRTSSDCKDYGCSNNAEQDTWGYWTSNANISSFPDAWRVGRSGDLNYGPVSDNRFGVRPVVTVSKSIIK